MELYFEEIDATNNIDEVVQMNEQGGEIRSLNLSQFSTPAGEEYRKQVQLPMAGRLYMCEQDKVSPRGGASLNSVNGISYLFGGANRSGSHFNDMWSIELKWDASQLHWSKIDHAGEPPSPRSGQCAIVINNELIVYFAGMNGQSVFNDVHVFEPADMTWTQPNISGCSPQGRTEHSGVSTMGGILYFGGSSPLSGPLRDMHFLDTDTFAWSTVRATGVPPSPREMHSAVLYGAPCNGTVDVYERIMTPTGNDDVDALRQEGNELFVGKEFESACQVYSRALELNNQQHTLFSNRSACYLQLGKPTLALEDALQAVSLQPRWAKGYVREALALVELRQYDSARNAFESAKELAVSRSERAGIISKLANLPEPSTSSEVESLDGSYMLVYGGRGIEGVCDDICIFDLKASKWLDCKIATPFPRCGHSFSVLPNHQFMAFGGWDGGDTVYEHPAVYDINSRMWTECYFKDDKSLGARFSHASVIHDESTTFIFGGVSFEKEFSDVVAVNYSSFQS